MKELMREILTSMGLPTDNCHIRKVLKRDNGVICLFEDNFDKGDFYFVPVMEDDKEEYYDGRLTIYVYRNPNKKDLKIIPSRNWLMYGVPLKSCVRVYDDLSKVEKRMSSTEDGSNIKFNSLSARDISCILLKVPSTDKDWLNSLIKESN